MGRPSTYLLIFGLCSWVVPCVAYAEGTSSAQFHFRTGYFHDGFSGPVNGSIDTFAAVDLEYEILTSSHASYTIGTTLIYELMTARVHYSGVNIGRRYYLLGGGMSYDYTDSVTAQQIVSIPKWRAYAGAVAGVSQVSVRYLSSAFQTQSSLIEIGSNMGGIYQLTKAIGLELQLGVSLGFGFTTVSVNAFNIRTLLGGTYYF